MLEVVQAIKFIRPMDQGRTRPSLVAIRDANGVEIEAVAKLSAGCDRKEDALIAEAITAMLAEDLGLPVPRPYFVELSAAFIDAIPNQEIRNLARQSCPICYGSRRLPQGARAWIAGSPVLPQDLEIAAAIFAFDALIDNVDRRVENTNLLVSGDRIWIYDHELAFASNLVLFWKPPWVVGARGHLAQPGKHVLFENLKGRMINLEALRVGLAKISDGRPLEYEKSIPDAWRKPENILKTALGLIASIRDNADACMAEVQRVLK
jgi:hypothetical protein